MIVVMSPQSTAEDLENCVNVIEAIAKILEAELRQNT